MPFKLISLYYVAAINRHKLQRLKTWFVYKTVSGLFEYTSCTLARLIQFVFLRSSSRAVASIVMLAHAPGVVAAAAASSHSLMLLVMSA